MNDDYDQLTTELQGAGVSLVAVSKTQTTEAIRRLYHRGQRIFGENRVQELLMKKPQLPVDIEWHLIGHLQSNKIAQITGNTAMIESLDSVRLIRLLAKEATKQQVVQDALIQIKISAEASKFGFDPDTVVRELSSPDIADQSFLRFRGVMGIASFTEDHSLIRREFQRLKTLFHELKSNVFMDAPGFDQISMGMSGDYRIAIEEGSTMVRIGSLLFGARK